MTQIHCTELMEVKSLTTDAVRYYAKKADKFCQVSREEYTKRYRAADNFCCMLSTNDGRLLRSYRTAIYRLHNFNPPTPVDATHFNPKGIYAVWYKQVNGVWFYWGGIGFWKPSVNAKVGKLNVELIPR